MGGCMRILRFRPSLRQRIVEAVRLLADGVCLQAELCERIGVSGGASKRLVGALLESGMAEQTMFKIGHVSYGLLRLTQAGQVFAAEQGFVVRPSEWDVLRLRHEGGQNSKHALGVLLFAYHARKRGWRVEVCPRVDHPLVVPDVLVERDGERVFVEVEMLRNPRRLRRGSDNTWVRKWANQYRFQGFVAVCTTTPHKRAGITAYLKRHYPGMATDLMSLARDGSSDLWLERWSEKDIFRQDGT